MINNEMFTNRLRVIFDYYELSASAFAEKMGVGRSSISHIISGRNKPSLDFVLHILKCFPEVSFDWLILGKGVFPVNNEKNEQAPTLFQNTNPKENSNQIILNNKAVIDEITEPVSNEPKITAETKDTVAIDRIIIFYKDKSFKEYKN